MALGFETQFACSSCSTSNAGSARYCQQCGGSLTSQSSIEITTEQETAISGTFTEAEDRLASIAYEYDRHARLFSQAFDTFRVQSENIWARFAAGRLDMRECEEKEAPIYNL